MRLILLLCVSISLWICKDSLALGDEITSQVSDPDECNIVIEDKEVKIDEITSLLKMDTVHMIDIQLFSGPNFAEPFFSQFQITLVDEWGREVISLLKFKYFIVTSTLTVGHIQQFNLHVNESYEGCIKAEKNPMNFLAGNLLKQFIVKLPMTSSQICHVDAAHAGSSQAKRTCCKVIDNYGSKCQCDKDQYQHDTFRFLSLPHLRTCFVLGAFLFIFIFFFIFSTEHDEHLSQALLNRYYCLDENTISIRYFVRLIIWEDCGESVSIMRRFVLVTSSFCVYFLLFRSLLQETWLEVLFITWGVFFFIHPSTVPFSPPIYEHRHQTPEYLVWILQFLKYDVHGICQGHHIECVSVKKLICLPFDIKGWKERFKGSFTENMDQSMIKYIRDHCCRIIVVLFCWLCIVPVFIIIICLILVSLLAKAYFFLKYLERTVVNFAKILYSIFYLLILVIPMSIIFMSIISLLIWLPFFTGLLCNITNFIPRITVILVNFYYLVQFWKSFNNKYHALKLFIYQEYQERKPKKGTTELELAVAKEELKTAKTKLETAYTEHITATEELDKVQKARKNATRNGGGDTGNGLGVAVNGQHATGNGQHATPNGRGDITNGFTTARKRGGAGNGRGAAGNGRGAAENGRGAAESTAGNGQEDKGNAWDAKGNGRGSKGNGRGAKGNGRGDKGNGRGVKSNGREGTRNELVAKEFTDAGTELIAAKNKFLTSKKKLDMAENTVFEEIETLANEYMNLAKANLDLATTNVYLAKATVKLAETNNDSADAERVKKQVKAAKNRVKSAKNAVEKASRDVESNSLNVNKTRASVKRAKDNVKKKLEQVDNHILVWEKRVKDVEGASISNVETGMSEVESAAENLTLFITIVKDNIQKPRDILNQPCELDQLCATVNDRRTKVRRTANVQLAIAYMLHLSLSQKGHIVPVISKKIYHKIQERILPYDTNLFGLVIKTFLIVLFTYFSIKYLMQRQESYFIDIVKVLTTISVSLLPYFFNVLFLTLNEHEKETWNEMIKVNVKHIVDELDNDPELDKTILILQRYTCNAERTGRSDEESGPTQDEEGGSTEVVSQPPVASIRTHEMLRILTEWHSNR